MTTSVQTTQSFQERLFEKIKSDIGSLMTDEELKKLVEQTMQKLFFDPVKKKDPHNTYREIETPAPIFALVKELVEPSLRKALKDWINEHPEELQKAIAPLINANLAKSLESLIYAIVEPSFTAMRMGVVKAFNDVRDGKPPYI